MGCEDYPGTPQARKCENDSGSLYPGGLKAKRKVALDAEADDTIAVMFPFLEAAVSLDGKQEEQAAQSSFNSEEDKQAGTRINENNSQYAREAKQVKQRWNNVRASQNIKRDRYGKAVKQGQATDSIKHNSIAAKPFSMFASAASIIKRQRKSA